jgi:ribosome-binding factor A
VSLRTERIGEQLRGEIARVLREELTDPRIGMLTLTRVDVSPDLSNAIVYWSPLEARAESDLDEIAAGLSSAAGFMRRHLAHTLSLRRMPALRFKYDSSVEAGSQILSLLSSLEEQRSHQADEDSDE